MAEKPTRREVIVQIAAGAAAAGALAPVRLARAKRLLSRRTSASRSTSF